MNDAFRELMGGLIDYAGIFPPAGLDMETAVSNYLAYADGEDRWMLGRFICPAARLLELTPLLRGSERAETPVSVILEDTDRHPGEIRDLLDAKPGLVEVGAFEARVPPELAADGGPAHIAAHVRGAAESLERAGLSGRPVFWEAGLGRLSAVVEGIAGSGHARVGLKLRCGGTEPAAFPSSENVARAIVCCREAGIPFKATAGLHHPVRRLDPDMGVPAHGFLNLFGAAVLAVTRGLPEETITRILEDEAADSFRFEGGSFAWREIAANAEEVLVSRFSFATSFGSCSFEEPREDLRLLGLLR